MSKASTGHPVSRENDATGISSEADFVSTNVRAGFSGDNEGTTVQKFVYKISTICEFIWVPNVHTFAK